MKKFINILFLLIAVAIAAPSLSAQNNSGPFTWRSNVKMLSATEGEVIVKVTIAQGWHLYGLQLPTGGPKPTVFDFSKSTGVKLKGKVVASKSPTEKYDKMFELKLNYWTGSVTFRQRFKVTNKRKARIEGTVNYMGCNDNTCSPPATFTISKPVVIK